MNTYGRSRLEWKGNDLFFHDQRVIAIYQKDDNPLLWQVGWNDGTMSKDYYNRTRAREHAMRIALRELNGVEEFEQDA